MNYSITVKRQLESLIGKMDQYPWLFVRTLARDFSRVKKWSFGEMMRFTISFICMSFLGIFWNCKESNRPVGHIVPTGLLLFLLTAWYHYYAGKISRPRFI